MFSRSLLHRLSADHFSPDPELSFALTWELESTPADIDAFRLVTTGNMDLKKLMIFPLAPRILLEVPRCIETTCGKATPSVH